jgi:membrane protein DedA with SNARE-associated domain
MQYSYLAIFVSLMLGIIGVPVPDELLLLYLGYDCRRGHLLLELGIPVAAAATICGITVSFTLGRWIGPLLVHRFGKYLRINQNQYDRARRSFDKIGHWALVLGFYIPGMRHMTALVAGAARLPWPRFMIFAYAGAMIWSAGFIVAGYFLGAKVPTVAAWVRPYLRLMATVVIVALLGAAAVYLLRKKPA